METTSSTAQEADAIWARALARLPQDLPPLPVPGDRRLDNWELDSFTSYGLPRLRVSLVTEFATTYLPEIVPNPAERAILARHGGGDRRLAAAIGERAGGDPLRVVIRQTPVRSFCYPLGYGVTARSAPGAVEHCMERVARAAGISLAPNRTALHYLVTDAPDRARLYLHWRASAAQVLEPLLDVLEGGAWHEFVWHSPYLVLHAFEGPAQGRWSEAQVSGDISRHFHSQSLDLPRGVPEAWTYGTFGPLEAYETPFRTVTVRQLGAAGLG